MNGLLEVLDLSKRYGAHLALQGVGFTLHPGEVLGLIGPNGSGKTTLLQALAGLLPVESGTVRFRGEPLPLERRKEVLFYIPDGIQPWPERRVGWVLDFFRALYGAPPEALREAQESLSLQPLLPTRMGALSKGQRKRVLLAAGLLTPQPLWLMDEPFDGLDLRQLREVAALLRSCPSRGRTLFLSMHQLTDAVRVCDRLVLLSSGRVAGEGTLDQLRQRAGLPRADLEEIFLALT